MFSCGPYSCKTYFKEFIKSLEQHLKLKQRMNQDYLVGNNITIADYIIFESLFCKFTFFYNSIFCSFFEITISIKLDLF